MAQAASNRLLAAVALLGALLPAGACDSTPPVNEENLLKDQAGFCRGLARSVCNPSVVQACYNSDDKSLAGDTDKCVAAVSQLTRCNPEALPYHPSGGQACIDAYSAAYGDAALTLDEKNNVATVCLAALSHKRGTGTSCVKNVDCDGSLGLRCILKGDAGSCGTPVVIMPGVDCSAPNAVCGEDLYCDAGKHCVKKQAASKSCANNLPCDSQSICDKTMTCASKKGNGQSCELDGECSGGFCVKASGQMMGTCGSKLPLSALSDSCALFKPGP